MTKLEPDARIAVVGGGPAGASFALHMLHLAPQVGLRPRVTIFEPRRFDAPGTAGCNMCAGLLAPHVAHDLARLGLRVPEPVVMSRIRSYRLHAPQGAVEVAQPHAMESVVTVYRGGGPDGAESEPEPGDRSFDRFLLESAIARGARHAEQRVEQIDTRGARPALKVDGDWVEVDLLVLATGINSPLTRKLPAPYEPPATVRMSQVELSADPGEVARLLGESVHVFVLPGDRLLFGTLIPKGRHVNVTLLGHGPDPMGIDEFLDNPRVQPWLPGEQEIVCKCSPRIAVGPARHPLGERLVVIGDAAGSRLYKDGIGSAMQSARAAAQTAALQGISARDFRRHYLPTCRRQARDNRVGNALFGLHRRVKDSPLFFDLQTQVLKGERTAPYTDRMLDQVNWGMFTGAYPYRQVALRLLSPRLWWRTAAAAIHRLFHRPESQGEDVPDIDPGSKPEPKRIVVLGGGFGGMGVIRRLERKLGKDPDVDIFLVSDENFFLFTPMLHEVASGGIETRHIASPIRRLRNRRRYRFIQATVEGIDLEARAVATDHGEIPYDILVLALGSHTDTRLIEGREHHVRGLKTLEDGIALRNHVIRMFEAASGGADDPSALLTFCVVGGGTNGVQTAGELNEMVRRELPRDYTAISADRVRVILIQDEPRLLPELQPRVALWARQALEEQGVEVWTGTRVDQVGDGFLTLENSTRVESRSVIWTPGIVANPVVAELPGVEHDELGRVVVDEHLRLPAYPEVFALGDNACQPDSRTGVPVPATAHVAVRQPRAVAPNVIAHLRGGKMRSYHYLHMGQLVSLGPRNALAQVFDLRMRGFLTRLLWQSAYSALMPGRYAQVRVWTDWILGQLFGRDSTLLRGR
jgi:NADH:ubiquinone reductase (H+-translocating)